MSLNCFYFQTKLKCSFENAIQALNPSESKMVNFTPMLLSKLESIYLKNDLVRCFILNVDKENDKCEVSIVPYSENITSAPKLVRNFLRFQFIL